MSRSRVISLDPGFSFNVYATLLSTTLIDKKGMRDARVAPVEDSVPTVPHEHLAVVQIVVLDGVGHDTQRLKPGPYLWDEIPE